MSLRYKLFGHFLNPRRLSSSSIPSLLKNSWNTPVNFSMKDHVYIDKLQVDAVIGPDFWDRINPQRCFVTLDMATDFGKASANDDLRYSLNYAVISKDVTKFVQSKDNWYSIGHLSRSLSRYTLARYEGIQKLTLSVETKTGHVRCDDISTVVQLSRNKTTAGEYDILKISNLKLLALIGVFTFERLQKQYVSLELELPWAKDAIHNPSYKAIVDIVVEYVENSNFKTVESLVESVAKIISLDRYFQEHSDLPLKVKVMKLNAITSTEGVGVSCITTPDELKSFRLLVEQSPSEHSLQNKFDLPIYSDTIRPSEIKWNSAFLAFGSNVGNKFCNIKSALHLLSLNPQVKVKNVSSLFESEPMYFANQDLFMNGCLEISTTLSPQDLLAFCKYVEYEELKRVKYFDNGPRTIDLDIIMYVNGDGDQVLINDPNLTIPHERLLERSFVLEPLCELLSHDTLHPVTCEPLIRHLEQIYSKGSLQDQLWKLIPLPQLNGTCRFLRFKYERKIDDFTGNLYSVAKSPSYLMCVLNITPDSFSDGGLYYGSLDQQMICVRNMYDKVLRLQENLIIDVGGCSTRPNAKQINEEAELERTIPLIKTIRSCSEFAQDKIIISIDTYRSNVAQKAIAAGADMVNDISGGTFDSEIFDVVAANPQIAYVLSHTRGDISNMSHLTEYDNGNGEEREFIFNKRCQTKGTGIIRNIAREMCNRYEVALDKGVRRWQIVLDPGLGFAKNGKQNLQIIRQLSMLKNYSRLSENGQYVTFRNIPLLLGPSRKAFIGNITKEPNAEQRDFATGAVAASCVGFGADMVRVHDYANCSKALKVADALYKGI